MTGDLGIYQLASVCFLARNRPFLVSLHEARVTNHVGCENGGEPAFHLQPPLCLRLADGDGKIQIASVGGNFGKWQETDIA